MRKVVGDGEHDGGNQGGSSIGGRDLRFGRVV
jgi:hypothetical protein